MKCIWSIKMKNKIIITKLIQLCFEPAKILLKMLWTCKTKLLKLCYENAKRKKDLNIKNKLNNEKY